MIAKANKDVPTKKIAFDSFTDIKSEIGPLAVKNEPKWEFEIDIMNNPNDVVKVETIDGKDIVIADTVIRKVESGNGYNLSNDNSQNFNIDVSCKIIPYIKVAYNFFLDNHNLKYYV